MALEDIKQMTRSLSEEKQVASHDAPEDYLKRAVEQFIIEFPEFEDLQGEELYKEMEKKGYFSDRWASSDYGIPITPDYMRDALLGGYGSHIHGLSDDELRNMDDDMIKEIYDDINEMFKYGKIDELKKEVQVASGPPAFDDELLKKSAWDIFGKPLKDLTDDEYEELEDMIYHMDVSPWDFVQRKGKKDIRRVNQGGIIGLRGGGDPRIEQQPEGIMQLASHTGDDVIQSAIIWAAGLPQFGSVGSVLDALNNADHPYAMDINGLVNAYMDARTESN